ncbi:TPA: hypothetical protein QEL15_002061 [Stenotrophomonas maltophilia]|nr:hypothetical protein [Stenotrophomonas maltophilia]
MTRPVLLIDVGADSLPAITPALRAPASWASLPSSALEIPPPTDVEIKPGVESVTITWQPSALPGAVYVVWRAPNINGAPGMWRIVTRTTDTRFTYTDATGTVSWWKVTVLVNGIGSGDSGQWPALPITPPTTAQLVEIQRKLDQESVDRFNADAKEAQKRADELAALANKLAEESSLRAQGLLDQASALQQEISDRIQALLNERLAWQAEVSREAATRQSAVESLAYALSLVSAGSGTQFDSKAIWYFASDAEGWTGVGQPTVVDGWLRPANATSFPYVQSPDHLGIDGAAYRFVKLRVKRVGAPAWTGRLQWNTEPAPIWNEARSIAVIEPLWDAQGVATLDFQDIPWWPEKVNAIRLQVGAVQETDNYFLIDWIAVGRPTPGAGVAFVQEQSEALVRADLAEASKRESLAAQLRGNYEGTDPAGVASGLFAAERNARVSGDAANAHATELLQARMPAGEGKLATEASVLEERTARSEGDAANASALQKLAVRMPDGDGKLAGVDAVDAVSGRIDATEGQLRAVGERATSLESQLRYRHAGDRDWRAGDRNVYAGVRTWQSVITEASRAIGKRVDVVNVEFGVFKASATNSIEVIASEQMAQAQRLEHVGAALEGKASSDYVEQINARVEQTASGLVAVSGQMESVKADLGGKASAQVVQGIEARVAGTESGLSSVRARAFLKLIADGGLGPLIGGMEMDNDGRTVSTRFSSHVFEVLTPNANTGYEIRDGYFRIWSGDVQRIIGNGFGKKEDILMDYFGPNVGAAAASKENATMWMDASGAFSFNGTIAGGYRTRVGNSGVFVYYPNGVAAVELGVLS